MIPKLNMSFFHAISFLKIFIITRHEILIPKLQAFRFSPNSLKSEVYHSLKQTVNILQYCGTR